MQDWQLLREYVDSGSQAAFAKLVERHLRPIYATCLREVSNAQMAEDLTQAVFLVLARKAHAIRPGIPLSGWLFTTARYAARNLQREEARRRAREQKAAFEMQAADQENDAWREIDPALNDAIAALNAPDREAILLRFYHDLTMAETGMSLGISEDAAKMRVGRAVEKLRRALAKSGVAVPAAGFAVLLTARAAEAMPEATAAAIIKALSGVTAASTLLAPHIAHISEGVIRTMWLAKVKIAVLAIGLCLIGTSAALIRHSGGTKAVIPVKPPAISRAAAIGSQILAGTALLTGKLTFADGKPAAGFEVAAQMQRHASDRLVSGPTSASNRAGTQKYVVPASLSHLAWAEDISKADGSYRLTVLTDLPYNVAVFDYTDHPGPAGKLAVPGTDRWVAVAAEGVVGREGAAVSVPNLILTHGGTIVGTILNKTTGKAFSNNGVACFGTERPESTAMVNMGPTDKAGHYRIRVAPGKHRVFTVDGARNASRIVVVKEGETKTVDLEETPKKPKRS